VRQVKLDFPPTPVGKPGHPALRTPHSAPRTRAPRTAHPRAPRTPRTPHPQGRMMSIEKLTDSAVNGPRSKIVTQ
jgi:hypothetical protein